jgi:hypothetical protein
MSTVQFDPKITPEFQIDWRRPSSQGADPFSDLLKRHFDTDQRPRAPKLREEAADPVSGRPPRVVVAHAKTLRGEAKRIEDADRRLTDQSSQGSAETCAKEDETVPLEDGAATDTETPEQDAAEAPSTTDATAEQSVTEDEAEVAAPVTPVVVSVQSTDEASADGETVATATPLLESTEDGILPEQTDQTSDTPSNGTGADSEATAEQQAVAAMAEAGLTDGVTALTTGQMAPAAGATPAAALAQAPALPTAPAKPEHPLLQMAQAPAPVVEAAPAAQPRPERSSMDIKLRAGASARPTPATPASPATATPAQPAQPHATTGLQPTAGGELGTGEPFDQAPSEDGTGQGWALHLAQGAASKRPDFVAQLRQHLQNLPAHEQVAVHLQRAVREGTNKFSIQLSPAELGNIHVKLEIDEEKRVTAAVTVERPSTLELLQRDTKGLERALHNAGLNMEGGDLSFSLGRGDQEFAQDLRQSGASAANGAVLDAESDGDQPDNPVAQVMDTAAGVVNLQV